MKGRKIQYSAEELWWLYSRSLLPIRRYHEAFVEEFGREDVKPMHLHSLRKRMGWKTGRTGCFEKGQEPHNKGKKCEPGKGGRHPNARKTQFKKGGKPHNTRWAGHERVSKDGYVEISVEQTNPHTGFERRYVLKHRWLWEQEHGPVPEGMVLKRLDGNKLNTDPSNWEAVPRAILPRLAGGTRRQLIAYDDAPDELKPAILTAAKLDHSAREKRRSA